MTEKLDNAATMDDVIKGSPDLSDRIPAPAKRWRNSYLAIKDFFCKDFGFVKNLDIVPGSGVWPSKEVAEQKAMTTYPGQALLGVHVKYLGAFPE